MKNAFWGIFTPKKGNLTNIYPSFFVEAVDVNNLVY
jgi:hypothetical protein